MQYLRDLLTNPDVPNQAPNAVTSPSRSVVAVEKKQEKPKPLKKLLIIDADDKKDYTTLFKDKRVHGEPIEVYRTGWKRTEVASYFYTDSQKENPVQVYVTFVQGDRMHTIQPDFVLIRNSIKEPQPSGQHQNLLYGLMYAGVPAINSLHSCYSMLERPVVFAELIKIRKKHGFAKFPLISQNYYANAQSMAIGPEFPAVAKVGHAHAGFGKMKFDNHHDFADFGTVLAMTEQYATGEPYYEGEYDLRVQKIGKHYRVYKRYSVSGNWKTNTGTAFLEEIPLTNEYKFWVDECSKIFGGLDILAVDAIHTTDGKEYILEVNDCSIGLGTAEEEDLPRIVNLTIQRMEEQCPRK